ncbi:hypothetical protein Emag_000301 [Eimeria magna]
MGPHRSYQPWAPAHGSVTGVNNHTLQVLGRVALEVRLGPLKTTAPFVVVPGVAFAALLGVDFLCEHENAVSLARHALIFEDHGGQIFPLLGHHPRLAPLCALAQDVALNPGNTAWVRTTIPAPATAPASPLVYLVAACTLPGVGLAIPEQLASGLIAIRNTSNRPLHLSAGWPLAKAVRLPSAAIHNVRLVATDPAPPPTDGTADAPAYEKVPGGFNPTVPLPNSCLLPAELQQLRNLLHEFRDRFSDGSEPLPATSLLKARLDTGDAQPISTPARRLSPAMRQAARDAAELDAPGITKPSTGCWSTPIVMVRKASGAWRLCCDYRAINKHVRIPQQPLPRTDDILASFNEEDRPKTRFVTPDCQRQYRRLPIGFASSPAIFQRMVDLLLGGVKWVSAVGYIDDIIVYSDNWDAQRAHLRQLLQTLRDANLHLHPGKCSFGSAAVRYLGHIVSRDGIKPCPSKVQAILEMPVPETAKAVQRFLGKCQYYRSYAPEGFQLDACRRHRLAHAVQGSQQRTCPRPPGLHAPLLPGLRRLRRRPGREAYPRTRSLLDHERKWTATELEAAALIWAPETFRHYIDTIEVCIRTDHAPLEYIPTIAPSAGASSAGLCACKNSGLRSYTAPAPSKNMSAVCLGQPFRQLPRSGPSSWTSSPPVRFCTPAPSTRRLPPPPYCGAPPCALRLTMWPTAHIGGCAFCGTPCATCLPYRFRRRQPPASAQPPDNAPAKVIHGGRSIPLPPAAEHLSLKDAQAQDPECQELLRLARTPRAAWPPHLRHTPLQFCVLHDLVYVRIGDALPRVVLPAIFRSRAIQAHHLSYYGGHFGFFKTAARLACRYWWPHLQRDVRAYFRRCPFCIANTEAPRKWKWLDLPIGTPFELIAIDLFGPVPVTRRGNNHVFVIIDLHTRWVELVPLPNPTAAQVAQALFNKWISRWRVPRALLPDNGPQFTAEFLRQLCTTLGISELFASPYNPRGNSIVESYMRGIGKADLDINVVVGAAESGPDGCASGADRRAHVAQAVPQKAHPPVCAVSDMINCSAQRGAPP